VKVRALFRGSLAMLFLGFLKCRLRRIISEQQDSD